MLNFNKHIKIQKKYRVLILLTLMNITFMYGQFEWNLVHNEPDINLNKFSSVNENLIFSVGSDGVLLKSIDTGENWTKITIPSTDNVTDIKFRSSMIGWYTTSSGKIGKTVDGGINWTEKTLHSESINSIDFFNGILLAAGNNGKILYSENDGEIWTNINEQTVFSFNDIKIINDTLSIAVGASGSIFKSNNGTLWTSIETSFFNSLSSIELNADLNEVLITGTTGISYKYNLINGIKSFSSIDTDWLKSIECTNKKICYYAGFNNSINISYNNKITIADTDFFANINSIHFINDSIGFISTTDGKIYKTTNGDYIVSSQKTLYNNPFKTYPNPTSGRIYIENLNTPFNIEILNAKGQIILQENNKTTIDISGMNNGYYFLKLMIDGNIFYHKIIKI